MKEGSREGAGKGQGRIRVRARSEHGVSMERAGREKGGAGIEHEA